MYNTSTLQFLVCKKIHEITGFKITVSGTENAVTAAIFMPRPPAELKVQMNFNAVSKNVRILKIGPVEQKLRVLAP